ncbi:hypothetical protein N7540_003076 [Penicillium herquei]|nr:hypothetical protein N7540_003076 [Penicillium herquei]
MGYGVYGLEGSIEIQAESRLQLSIRSNRILDKETPTLSDSQEQLTPPYSLYKIFLLPFK